MGPRSRGRTRPSRPAGAGAAVPRVRSIPCVRPAGRCSLSSCRELYKRLTQLSSTSVQDSRASAEYALDMGNREDLLEGAKRCLLEKGYRATTARDIAAASGVSLAAIGYHFGSKEALM